MATTKLRTRALTKAFKVLRKDTTPSERTHIIKHEKAMHAAISQETDPSLIKTMKKARRANIRRLAGTKRYLQRAEAIDK